jgi:6-phosphogluconolactonase/glucosamine-6-phosphate isomerase/deaminase
MKYKQRRATHAQSKYTELQPKDGEVVLHCGHVGGEGHFFSIKPEAQVVSPSGEVVTAQWFIQCASCFRTEPSELNVRGHGIWCGDEPTIRLPEYN